MKKLTLMMMLLPALAFGQLADSPLADRPQADGQVADAPLADLPQADGQVADAPLADLPQADAPLADAPAADAPLADAPAADAPLADAPLADLPSVSVKLDEGQPAPFHGRLLSPTEQVRRGKVAERERAELLELKKPENVTLTKAALISIASGSAVLAAVIAGLAVGFARQPPTK